MLLVIKTLEDEWYVVIKVYKLTVFEILRDFFVLSYIAWPHYPYIRVYRLYDKAEAVLLNFVSDRCTIYLEGCHQCTAFSIFQVYHIGVQLDVATHTLSNIEQQFNSPVRCLTELLDYWMNNATYPPPSWKVLTDALKASSVGEKKVAGEVVEKYCNQKEQGSCSESDPLVEAKSQQGTSLQSCSKEWCIFVQAKKLQYLTLVHSKLQYCSPYGVLSS